MSRIPHRTALSILMLFAVGCAPSPARSGVAGGGAVDPGTLALSDELRADGRTLAPRVDGGRSGVHISAAQGEGVAWAEGVEFETGVIELEVKGKDVQGQSFLGVAFAGANDSTYEAVYVRPFNFATTDPVRKIHAVQYISHPAYPWARLRAEQAEVFENPVDPVPDPNAWVRLRLEVDPARVRVFVGAGREPDLVVDRLGDRRGRRVGLWVGNGSDGDFANLRIMPG